MSFWGGISIEEWGLQGERGIGAVAYFFIRVGLLQGRLAILKRGW